MIEILNYSLVTKEMKQNKTLIIIIVFFPCSIFPFKETRLPFSIFLFFECVLVRLLLHSFIHLFVPGSGIPHLQLLLFSTHPHTTPHNNLGFTGSRRSGRVCGCLSGFSGSLAVWCGVWVGGRMDLLVCVLWER